MVGVIMIVAGFAKLGFVADLLSKPTMIGYMNGLALTIVIGQLPKLLGFSVDADGLIGETPASSRAWPTGSVPGRAAVGLGGIVSSWCSSAGCPKVPAVLVMVVLAIAVSSIFDLGRRGVSLIGVLPQGFPR